MFGLPDAKITQEPPAMPDTTGTGGGEGVGWVVYGKGKSVETSLFPVRLDVAYFNPLFYSFSPVKRIMYDHHYSNGTEARDLYA